MPSKRIAGPFKCKNLHCGKIFYAFPSSSGVYCSKRCCRRIYPFRKSICTVCHKEYEVRSSQHAGKFCSIQCKYGRQITRSCLVCKKEFKVAQCVTKKCCSRICDSIFKKQNPERRIWPKVTKTDGCWLWTGAKNRWGYGNILYKGRIYLAHRAVYEITVNPIPSKLNLLHRCDNRACVRPDHMFLGTILDNVRDMHEKGRALKGFRGKSIRQHIWQNILKFYNYKCAQCNSDGPLVKDHYRSIADGGLTVPENVWPLCKRCNQIKHRKSLPGFPPHVDNPSNIRDSVNG